MCPDELISEADKQLLAELDRRAAPTRDQAAAALWVYGSVEDLVIQAGRWYLPTVAPLPAGGFSGVARQARERGLQYVEGFLLDVNYVLREAAWAANGDLIVVGTAGGLAFRGVPLRAGFADIVRKRSGSASVLHGQRLDRWRLLEFGFPRNALVDTT
ncbi:hypothetical protein [Kutzneria chonburiensis]|uniref:SnoaL-like domain-containing protein n=1 Tax=Kutzneria chonburiensis TaxID=1483604 RepID=A0ABV6MK17_9PSEU|nr:hypothetical protein [Kutzneria chonburiensis]